VILGGVAGLAALAALAAALWRRSGALVPLVLGIASLAVAALAAARIGVRGDRYLAVPRGCGAWGVARAASRLTATPRRIAFVGVAVVALGLAVVSSAHVRVYASDASLWSDAWRRNPRSARAATNLAVVALADGDAAGARAWLARAAALESGDPVIAINRAVVAQELGEPAEARRILESLAAERPGHWPAQVRLGHLALDREDLPEAAQRYELALRGHPLDAEAWAGLGVTRARQGRRDEARRALARALTLDPEVQNAEALRGMLRDLEAGGSR
jgi:tetratricopeptide (TPR) repeat protein